MIGGFMMRIRRTIRIHGVDKRIGDLLSYTCFYFDDYAIPMRDVVQYVLKKHPGSTSHDWSFE